MNIQSCKVTVVPLYCPCSENAYVPAILGHLKDVTLHHYSNVRMRFSSDLDSISEPFSAQLWCYEGHFTLLLPLSALSLTRPYLCNASSDPEQNCLIGRRVLIVHVCNVFYLMRLLDSFYFSLQALLCIVFVCCFDYD